MAPLAQPPKRLRVPENLSASARETWERETSLYVYVSGYMTESTADVMKRFPQEKKEPDLAYHRRVELIRRHEAALEAGRAAPEQNARTHGLTARVFHLAPGESEAEYALKVQDALNRYQPEDSHELDQVVTIVNSSWLLGRLQGIASDLLNQGLEKGTRDADSFTECQDELTGLSRYEGSLNRTLDKARKRLKELREESRSGFFSPVEKAEEEITKRTPAPTSGSIPTPNAQRLTPRSLPSPTANRQPLTANPEQITERTHSEAEIEPEKKNYKTNPEPLEPSGPNTATPQHRNTVTPPKPFSLADYPPGSTPIEDVLAAMKEHGQTGSELALLSQGYWYKKRKPVYYHLQPDEDE